MICWSDHQTMALQWAISNAKSNFYRISYIWQIWNIISDIIYKRTQILSHLLIDNVPFLFSASRGLLHGFFLSWRFDRKSRWPTSCTRKSWSWRWTAKRGTWSDSMRSVIVEIMWTCFNAIEFSSTRHGLVSLFTKLSRHRFLLTSKGFYLWKGIRSLSMNWRHLQTVENIGKGTYSSQTWYYSKKPRVRTWLLRPVMLKFAS